MADKDFEHIIQSRFEGFESAPPESVWSNINNLRDRRKLLLSLLWLLPIFAIAGGAFALYIVNASELNIKFQDIDLQSTYTYQPKQSIQHETTDEPNPSEVISTSVTSDLSPEANAFHITPVSQNLPATVKEEIPKTAKEIELSNMRTLEVEPSLLELKLQPSWLGGTSMRITYNWQKSIGIRLGSFVSVSRARSQWAQPPPTTLLEESNGYSSASYNRFLEIAPYFEWKHLPSGLSIRTHLLYSASNVIAVHEQADFLGNQTSIGLGAGGSYSFVRGRFNASAYLDLQGERLRTRFTNGNSYPWFMTDDEAFANQNNGVTVMPSRYNQWILSAEAGIRCEYILPNPWWSIHAGAGYRNYFWQQKVTSTGDGGTIKIPQLVQLNVGISYTF